MIGGQILGAGLGFDAAPDVHGGADEVTHAVSGSTQHPP